MNKEIRLQKYGFLSEICRYHLYFCIPLVGR